MPPGPDVLKSVKNSKKLWMFSHCTIYHSQRALSSKLSRITTMNGKKVKHCSLCFHNGEPEDYYRCDFLYFIERVWPIILANQVVRV